MTHRLLRIALPCAALALLGACQGPDQNLTNVPTVSSTNPAANATQVPLDAHPTATFNVPMDPATLSNATFTLSNEDEGPVTGTVTVGGNTVSFVPSAPLIANSNYTATITTAVRSQAGLAPAAPFSWKFTTLSGVAKISGRVTFNWVPAVPATSNVPAHLDYLRMEERPARRVMVRALDAAGHIVSRTVSDDNGNYTLAGIIDGTSVSVRALARTLATANVPDGIAPDRCTGASWDIRVVDNYHDQAQWVLDTNAVTVHGAATVNLLAGVSHSVSGYSERGGAVFAILDDLVSELELACEGAPNINFPLLMVNWSENNVPASGDPANGDITTSHYTRDSSGVSQLYILGKEDVDTDEFDNHVVAHEFGHFLEDRLFRSDSIGGSHSLGDWLDPRVAFGEGYGNALSAMVFNDPVYVDTNDTDQANGFDFSMADAPVVDDRGVYSETSMQHLLWKLYDNRDLTQNSGSFDRIYSVLLQHQASTPALTTGQSFASYYNAMYGGSAEQLSTLWGSVLDGSYDSLCAGTCNGAAGGTADPFDTDNDLGKRYFSAGRTYYGATVPDAEFWRLYKTIGGSGFAAPGDSHDQIFGLKVVGANKLGSNRWYRFTSTGTAKTITITSPSNGCSNNSLNAFLYFSGKLVGKFASASACEQISVPATAGDYVLVIQGNNDTDTTGWGLQIQ